MKTAIDEIKTNHFKLLETRKNACEESIQVLLYLFLTTKVYIRPLFTHKDRVRCSVTDFCNDEMGGYKRIKIPLPIYLNKPDDPSKEQ